MSITTRGHAYVRPALNKRHGARTGETKYQEISALANLFRSLLSRLEIHGEGRNGRMRLGFYALRHTFVSVAAQTRDRTAVKRIMGHSDDDMLDRYEHGVGDDRLQAVVTHVHNWLFGGGK